VDWIGFVATFLSGGLLGTIITAWRTGASEYYADVRHLRDLQAERVRASFKPLLEVARVLSDVTQQLNSPLQPANTDARDKSINEAITKAMAEIVKARIALQLEPRVSKRIDPLFENTLRAYQSFQITYQTRENLRARGIGSGPELSYERTNEQAETVVKTTEVLHAEMLLLLERLDEPANKPFYIRA
jgi:hypothetical protein